MAAGDPIPLGSVVQNIFVPGADSKITTDEFGIQRGTIRFGLGDQTFAQSLRPAKGTPYTGALPQFRGFLVDDSGDILGGEGKTASVDITYGALDPRFVPLPTLSADLEYKDMGPLVTFSGGTGSQFAQSNVPIPHPLLTYKFSDKKAQKKRGNFGFPPNAPEVDRFVFTIYVIDAATIDTSNGHFEFTSFDTVPALNIIFLPAPAGWLCVKDDATPVCGGKLFAIEQQWKRFYIFAGFEKP